MPTTSQPSSSAVDVALPTRELSPESPAGDATVAVPASGPNGGPSAAQSDPVATEAIAGGLAPGPFGRYHIERLLGRGAMGAVYLARDTELQRFVALKIPLFDAHSTPQQVERFFREARSAAVLHHPGICPVYDVGEQDGVRFLAMAYIEGRPLADYVKPGRLQPERHVALVVRKLALALQAAHDKGIVHRDLKPGNVMIDSRNEPIVMDFGLALRFDDASEATLTKEGTVVGTPAYMAPEQLSSRRELGPACDIWALGVILYELLTGIRPFQGPVVTLIAGILHEDPRPVAELRTDVSPPLAEICRKALAKDPAQRFASMNDFALALADFLKGPAATATATTAAPAPGAAAATPYATEDRRADPVPRTQSVRRPGASRSATKSSRSERSEWDDLLDEAEALPPVARRPKASSGRSKSSGGANRNALWFALGGVASTLVVLGIVLAFVWTGTPRSTEQSPDAGNAPHEPITVAATGNGANAADATPDADSSTSPEPEPRAVPNDPPAAGPSSDPAPSPSLPVATNPPTDTPPAIPAQPPTAVVPTSPTQPPANSGSSPPNGEPKTRPQTPEGSPPVPDVSADEHFANHDRNGDGSLFPTEIPLHIIERCDANNDHRLSRTEFRKGFEKFGAKLFDPPEGQAGGPGPGNGPPNGPFPLRPGGPLRPRRPN